MLSPIQRHFFHWFLDFKKSERISSNEDDSILKSRHEKLIDYICDIGIKVIASDFDLTVMCKHSGGYIDFSDVSSDVFSKSLSREFNIFATIASKKNIFINIVTFSDPELIPYNKRNKYVSGKAMIDHCLKINNVTFNVDNYYCFYPKLWQDEPSYSRLNLKHPMPPYKTYHLSRICEAYGLSPKQILFIDDDIDNCAQALKEGYIVLHIRGSGYSLKNADVNFYNNSKNS